MLHSSLSSLGWVEGGAAPVVEWDGCIVILGVGVDTITLWHYYEDLLDVGYLGYYHPEARHLSYCATGKRIQYDFPGIMQDVWSGPPGS